MDRWIFGLPSWRAICEFLLAQQLASLPSTLADALRKASVRRPRANLCAGSRFDACPKLDGIDTWSKMIGRFPVEVSIMFDSLLPKRPWEMGPERSMVKRINKLYMRLRSKFML